MKRLNPQTCRPFKQGDLRGDGFIFIGYRLNKVRKTGFFAEYWASPESFKKYKAIGRGWRESNLDRIRELMVEYLAKNKGRERIRWQKYKSDNKDKVNALVAKRRSAKLQRTPKWLTEEQLSEIEELFTIAQMFRMYTGQMYHVDHIVPLQGKTVSGLHVPWNLQVITASENISKGNKHE